MKIAFVSAPPDRLWADKLRWLVDAFAALGHETRRLHHIDELAAADDWADLVLFDQYAASLPPGNFPQAADDKTAIWAQCWRDLICTDPKAPVARQETCHANGRVMRTMDAVFVKERLRIDEYRAAGINAVYLDCQGCPADMPAAEHREQPEFDVLVLGNAYRAYADRRADAAALVQAGYKVLWAGHSNTAGPHGVHGHPWVHPTKQLPQLASRCAVALSVDLRHEPGYTSDRTYLLAGCGIPVVTRVPEFGAESSLQFEAAVSPQIDVASWIYSDAEGLLACMKVAMASASERRTRGESGRRRVMEKHTYQQRAEAILGHLMGPIKKSCDDKHLEKIVA